MRRVFITGLILIVVCTGVWLGIMWWKRSSGEDVYRMMEVCAPCLKGRGLNNQGEVAGVVTVLKPASGGKSRAHAGMWAPGMGTTDLGTLGGVESKAQDLNDDGLVVGIADLPPLQTAYYGMQKQSDGFIWKRGARLQGMKQQKGNRYIRGISPVAMNNGGQIVGCATFPREAGYHAFIWDPQRGIKDLGTLGGKYSCAVDVNDQGQVIGNSDIPGSGSESPSHPFLWESGKGLQDLGTLGGLNSYARNINGAGQVVGSSDTMDGPLHAFVWDSTRGMRDIGALGGKVSGATAINDAGVVVGDSDIRGDRDSHPFVWDDSRGMRSLRRATLSDCNNA